MGGLEAFLQGSGERLQGMIKSIGGGYIAVNNREGRLPDGSPSPQVQELVTRASFVAKPCPLCKLREDKPYGRKSARRMRQLKAGLISLPPPPQPAKPKKDDDGGTEEAPSGFRACAVM